MIPLLLACSGPAPKPDTGARDTDPLVVDTDTGGDTARDTSVETDTDTGVDTDTAPAGTDADGDGHVALADGGDDCDDANPYVYAGATEYCDTVDQDCYGDPMGDARCNVPVPVAAAGRLLVQLGPEDNPGRESWSDALGAVFVGDVTGDGIDDVARVRGYHGDSLVYAGGEWPTAPYRETTDGAWHRLTGLDWRGPSDAGDINGDGWDDLVFHDAFYGQYTIIWGPLAGPGASSAVDDGAQWPTYFYNGFTQTLAENVDFDGDGRTDMVAVDRSYVEPTVDITYAVYFGGDTHEECSLYADPWHGMSAIGDGDGDGLAEGAWGDDEGIWIIPGADLRSACGGNIQTFASGFLPHLDDEWLVPRATLGDWSGDGLDEWVAYGYDRGDIGDEALWVFSAAATVRGESSAETAAGSWVLAEASTMYPEDVLDMDGDGRKELVLQHAGTYVLPPDTPLSIAADLPDTRYAIDDGTAYIYGHGDFDGDGREELLYIDRDSDAFTSNARFFPGFDIPWDDPTRW